MSTLSRNPRGLLSLLGLRDMGAVPNDLSNTIVSGIDLTQFLMLDREFQTGTITFSSVTSGAMLTVPPGELWYVHNFAVTSGILLAGERIKITPGFFQDGFYVAAGLPDTASVTGSRAEAYIEENFFLPPGGQLAARTNDIVTAASISVTGNAIITRLRI